MILPTQSDTTITTHVVFVDQDGLQAVQLATSRDVAEAIKNIPPGFMAEHCFFYDAVTVRDPKKPGQVTLRADIGDYYDL